MGCNCQKSIKQDKERIRKLAILTAVANEENIQIYSWTERGTGRLYDYEPEGFNKRGRGIVEVIKFRQHKSKNVLPDSKGVIGDSQQPEKPKKRGKSKQKNSGNKPEVATNDESVGESKAGDSSKEVATDN